MTEDLEGYVRKLTNAKRKLQSAMSLLDSTQDRIVKLKVSIAKASKKKLEALAKARPVTSSAPATPTAAPAPGANAATPDP